MRRCDTRIIASFYLYACCGGCELLSDLLRVHCERRGETVISSPLCSPGTVEMFTKEDVMETVVILFMTLLVLDAAAWRWGFDSRVTWNRGAWERGLHW